MASEQHNLIFLGVALKYPIEIDQFGRPVLITGQSLLQQSITIILNTELGSKFFQEDWGSRIREVLFEANDPAMEGLLSAYTKEAIDKWEKRVTFTGVTFSYPSVDSVNLRISYRINATNQDGSFVYPFYKALKY